VVWLTVGFIQEIQKIIHINCSSVTFVSNFAIVVIV